MALLCHMYNLVSDKRQPRNSLLTGLVKVLEVDLTSPEVEVILFCQHQWLLCSHQVLMINLITNFIIYPIVGYAG